MELSLVGIHTLVKQCECTLINAHQVLQEQRKTLVCMGGALSWEGVAIGQLRNIKLIRQKQIQCGGKL